MRFGLFRVRSPLLTESRLFSVPVGTEMFHFPTFPPTALCVQAEVAGHYSGFFRGFPIRTRFRYGYGTRLNLATQR